MSRKLIQKELKINGMTCVSCEMRIENKLKKLQGIVKAKVSYADSNAIISFDPNTIQLDKITEEIEKLDYIVMDNIAGGNNMKKSKTTKDDKFSINQLLGIGFIILAGYLIIKSTVGF